MIGELLLEPAVVFLGVLVIPKRAASPTPRVLDPNFPASTVGTDRHFFLYSSKSATAILTAARYLVETSSPEAMSRLMVDTETPAALAQSSMVRSGGESTTFTSSCLTSKRRETAQRQRGSGD